MPGSSELSDALNPNFYAQRRENYSGDDSPSHDQQQAGAYHASRVQTYDQSLSTEHPILSEVDTANGNVRNDPHRSELEDAIIPVAPLADQSNVASPSISVTTARQYVTQMMDYEYDD